MGNKTFLLGLILFSFYLNLLVNHPSESLKSLGYNQFLDWYAHKVTPLAEMKVLYNPGLRQLGIESDQVKIGAIIPDGSNNFGENLDHLLKLNCQAIVECSAMDTWHSSPEGLNYLMKMRRTAYRVVVFDGGHHLPTLGLAPDIIIIPEINGYACHSYMLDGMKTEKIMVLARDSGYPSLIVAVPRWALVKNQTSLEQLAGKALELADYQPDFKSFHPQAYNRISKQRGIVFAYIDRGYSRDPALFIERLQRLGKGDTQKIYLSFDYRAVTSQQALNYKNEVVRATGLPVQIVNQPVKVANVFWGGR